MVSKEGTFETRDLPPYISSGVRFLKDRMMMGMMGAQAEQCARMG